MEGDTDDPNQNDLNGIPGLGDLNAPDPLQTSDSDADAHPSEQVPAEFIDSTSPPEEPFAAEPLVSEDAPADPLQKVKEFSEQMPMEKVDVPAAYPFSLLIEGKLLPEEREKLLDVLSRENMGIREVDLEPQFEGDRVLIPRISEYAGILLVQALRGTSAKMRLGPSDTIFATDDTSAASDPMKVGMRNVGPEVHTTPEEFNHPAENIVVTTAESLPGLTSYEVIDVLVASTILQSIAVEAAKTTEYQDVLENLKRELKLKAHRKAATAILQFQAQLQPLTLATQYRVTVTGTAIRATSAGPSLSADSPPVETSH